MSIPYAIQESDIDLNEIIFFQTFKIIWASKDGIILQTKTAKV